jgi:cell division protein ZapA
MAKKQPETPAGYTTVSIYDQTYHLTGQDPKHIRRLAELVDSKMRAVAAKSSTGDSLRVAVLAALNLADELSQSGTANTRPAHDRAVTLRGMLDEVLDSDRKTGS